MAKNKPKSSGKQQESAKQRAERIRMQAQKDFENNQNAEYDEDEAYSEASRKAGRGCLIAFLVILAVFLLGALLVFSWVKAEVGGKKATATDSVIVVTIAQGSGSSGVAKALKESGMISSEPFFKLYLKLKSKLGNFQAGNFELTPGMTYDQIIEALSKAPPPRETVWVTIPEGSTVIRFAQILESKGLCTIEEFLDVINNGDFNQIPFFKRLSEDYDPGVFMRAEGYLAPNTFEFYTDETPYNIAYKLFDQFDKDISPYYERMDELNLSLRETLTLASLIEEEAGIPDNPEDPNDPRNQAKVSGVFWNRLTGDWPLRTMGSDVTFYYLRDWVAMDYGGNYREVPMNDEYKNIPHDLFYAYYTADNDPESRKGLPAGPISCPSVNAISAALYPEHHNYYYFLTDLDGNYYYANTYDQHLANDEAAKIVNEGHK